MTESLALAASPGAFGQAGDGQAAGPSCPRVPLKLSRADFGALLCAEGGGYNGGSRPKERPEIHWYPLRASPREANEGADETSQGVSRSLA